MQMNLSPADMPTMDDLPSPDTNGDAEREQEDRQLDQITASANLAEGLSEQELIDLGQHCKRGFEADLQTRSYWEHQVKDWQKLALQIAEEKTWPWPNAANVKYPLLSTASMQFAARAYPSLLPSNGKVVKARVIGKDIKGDKLARADRVSTYMSYQVMDQLSYWEEDMDKMLIMLPVVGCMFKKTYYNKQKDRVDSCLVMPMNMVVNKWTTRIEDAERISEIIPISQRAFKEKQLQKVYLDDVELGTPQMPPEETHGWETASDTETIPYEIIEQHTYYDLDNDGYQEPLIVSFERASGTVVRVSIRYYLDDVKRNEKEQIVGITPMNMYTKYSFVPSADGSFYDVGFGNLLGPLNESVNTLINQLLDSGTLNVLNGGFIGKGLRVKSGDTGFSPGEWKPVNGTGDDLRKQIVQLPSKEPPGVLLELLKFLVQAGKELASVAEIFTGKMPGQNTPATTTMATVEQGMKVFTAVYKRIFRSLAEEFQKIFILNSKYLDPNKYINVLDITIDPSDFDIDGVDITPAADPSAVSQNEKLQKAQGLLEIMQMMPGVLDPLKVIIRVLEAQEQPNYQELFSQQVAQTGQLPPPPPDPKVMALQAKMQADQQSAAISVQQKQQEMELSARDRQMQLAMAAQEHDQKMQAQAQEMQQKAVSSLNTTRVKLATAQAHAVQKLQQSNEQHTQKLQQIKETSKLAQSQRSSGKSGKTTR